MKILREEFFNLSVTAFAVVIQSQSILWDPRDPELLGRLFCTSLPTAQSLLERSTKCNDVESRLLNRLQPRNQALLFGIDRYFDSPRVNINDMKDQNWLCNWWQINKGEYPQMAAATGDYLAIPASEVQ